MTKNKEKKVFFTKNRRIVEGFEIKEGKILVDREKICNVEPWNYLTLEEAKEEQIRDMNAELDSLVKKVEELRGAYNDSWIDIKDLKDWKTHRDKLWKTEQDRLMEEKHEKLRKERDEIEEKQNISTPPDDELNVWAKIVLLMIAGFAMWLIIN